MFYHLVELIAIMKEVCNVKHN